jgi:hypothetical protein
VGASGKSEHHYRWLNLSVTTWPMDHASTTTTPNETAYRTVVICFVLMR